jgi:transposase-like protein
MSMRAVPFYCPYCAEQSLVPVGDKAFHCESCDRTFEINFLGVGDGAAP